MRCTLLVAMACTRAQRVRARNWSLASRRREPRFHPLSDGAATASAIEMITMTMMSSISVKARGCLRAGCMRRSLSGREIRDVVAALAAVGPEGVEAIAVRGGAAGEPVDVVVAPRVLWHAALQVRAAPVLHVARRLDQRPQPFFGRRITA